MRDLTPASPAKDHCEAFSRISAVVHGCSHTRVSVDGTETVVIVVVVVVVGAGGGGGGGGIDVDGALGI